MNSIENKTVAEMVSDNINTAHIFKKYGIDFCCGGDVSIAKACEKHHVDLEKILNDLNHINSANKTFDYLSWDLDFLTMHIENIHHQYVEENIPLIKTYAQKVAKVHGKNNPNLHQVKTLFDEVAGELTAHMKKEELILFPFIKKMSKAEQNKETLARPHFGSVNNPIDMMEHEHEAAGNIFKQIRQLTNQYTPPEYACNTYKALYHKLEEFENDLHLHIHLENNILFPRALKLEQKIYS
ncbi:iron-sulfur cluster repair di-iron protein [Flavobacteriaceae bacterium 14752]|uniref:iron-sulfur cluster repair di-iron protein n=1 Tax=Mesohalobacter salilacus TaxID=2491711 RepID=UPI000F631F52|nr:iron-sulfur cluster repair di-iron protein [Flavobacteriaceae bacterium 14752]